MERITAGSLGQDVKLHLSNFSSDASVKGERKRVACLEALLLKINTYSTADAVFVLLFIAAWLGREDTFGWKNVLYRS